MQIIREQTIEWPDHGPLKLLAPALAVTVTVSPNVARRHANGYLGSEVAMSILAHNPRLVVGERVTWRFDADLNLPGFGQMATLGSVDVDAETGIVIPLSSAQIEELLNRANALASRLTPATAAGI